MRILYGEWKKWLSARFFWFLFLVMILVSGFAQVYRTGQRHYSPKEYQTLMATLSKMSPEDASKTVDDMISSFASTGDWTFSLELMADVQEDMSLLKSYPDYLSGMQNRTNALGVMAIWGGKDSFSYRNIQKTPAAYARLTEIELKPGNSMGITEALGNPLTDIVLVILLFMAASQVMIKDRESGMTPLLYATPQGRGTLFAAKLALVSLFTVAAVAILYGENLFIGAMTYGLGDLSRPVQSIPEFYQCNLPLSVAEYLGLFFLMKIAACLVFAASFLVIAAVAKNSLTVYGVSGGFCGLFYLLYRFVPAMSAAGVLHYLNPVQFLRVNEILGGYTNINLFGYPFSLKISSLSCMALWFAIGTGTALVIFTQSRNRQYRAVLSRQFGKRNVAHGNFWYVGYRSLILQKGLVVALLSVTAALIFALGTTRIYTRDDLYYERFTTNYQGVVTEATHDFIREKKDRYAQLEEEKEALIAQGASDMAISEITNDMLDKYALQLFETRVHAIENSGAAGELFYDTGYLRILGVDGGQDNLILLMLEMISLALLLSPYAATDRKTGMIRILYATKTGRRGYWKILLCYSALSAIITVLLFGVPYAGQILRLYGAQGLFAPLQSLTLFAGWKIPLPLIALLLLWLLCKILIAIVAAVLMNVIASLSRSPLAAYILNLCLFAFPVGVWLILNHAS